MNAMKTLRYLCARLLLGTVVAVAFYGCSDENVPENLVPYVTIDDAGNITYTSALLTGSASMQSDRFTQFYRFRYGTSSEMENEIQADGEKNLLTAALTDLVPGTTYYYCLEVGNAAYQVRSETKTFSTRPYEHPTLDEVAMVGQGPTSILLQCPVVDNGGHAVQECGFVISKAGSDTETDVAGNIVEDTCIYGHISHLEMETDYTVRAYADNTSGRIYSQAFSFRTGNAVLVLKTGILAELIGEENIGSYTTLSLAGPLDGSDLRFLRRMMGRDYEDQATKGTLTKVDMTDVYIKEGGKAYAKGMFTSNDTVGYYLFGNLEKLEELKLPTATESIAENAFYNCARLKQLFIPSFVNAVVSSAQCNALEQITVAADNPFYSSADGVLYDKEQKSLIWFPPAFQQEELSFPSTLESLGEFALQGCKIRRIVFPDSLTELERQVFYASSVEEVVLPDRLGYVRSGLFQSCTQLKAVTIGSQCLWVGLLAFDGCTALETITILATDPPVCDNSAFNGTGDLYDRCILYVPLQSREIYINHSRWGKFVRIEGVEGEGS